MNINNIVNSVVDYLMQLGLLGGFFLIILESIIPILPLAVFIGLNILAFGNVLGFFISWLGTVSGSLLSYFLFRGYFHDKLYNMVMKSKKHQQIMSIMEKFTKVKMSTLAVIIAIPFTPAFLVNIAAGLVKMPIKKFIPALLIGKVSLVLFWGYVGTTFLESVTNPLALIKIIILLGASYVISKIISKALGLKEE